MATTTCRGHFARWVRHRSIKSISRSHNPSCTRISLACDKAESPAFRIGSGATSVTVAVRWDIEAFGPTWWDKANVHAVRTSDGKHTVLEPTGRTYNATSPSGAPLCHITPDDGWAFTDTHMARATKTAKRRVMGSS